MENKAQNKGGKTVEDFIGIQDLYYLCLNKWYWFVLSLALTFSIATAYLLTTPPTYTRTAELLIKEDAKGNSLSGGMEQTFADMGLFKANTNVNNEIISIKSPDNLYEVVKRLNLNVNYFVEGRFHRKVAYGQSLPVQVNFLDILENTSCEFTIDGDEQGNVVLTDWNKVENGEETQIKEEVKGLLKDTLSTPVGRIVIAPTLNYAKEAFQLYVNQVPLHTATRNYKKLLNVGLSEEKASVITLTLSDVCPQRADDVLNTVISVYNENWVKDKNQIAVSTSMFINDRLNVIERELGNVDQNISSFKSEHLLPDVQAASNLYMTQSSQTNAQILALNNQLYMTKYIRGYLTDNANKNQLLPANSGIENSNIETQITEYNKQLLERNGLVASSSEKNPLVIDIDMALVSIRQAIIKSIDNQITTLNAQINSLQMSEKQTTSKIAANPDQAKYLLSVERQQKVKEALYLFLLQKREENELSQAFTAYNTRVITRPNGENEPSSPVKKKILFIAIVLGIVIPTLIIFMRENMNTKVRGRKDLENLSIPLIGEIPQAYSKKKGFIKKGIINSRAILVKEGSRDIINEAFRVLRTNLEFMSGKDRQSNVIVITSFNPGSGKTFLTVNTALSLAIKKKRVLLIDGDMRHASLSSYFKSPKVGLSNYLSGNVENYADCIIQDGKYDSLNILPVGTIPPNPTELLFEDLFKVLLDNVKSQYDFVLIDCPPVELVADTQIIENLADRTIFVVRAGVLERGMLTELQDIYDNNKYKNMSLVLNGTEGAGNNRYGYKYGYRYGYHYGYGDGYHYGSDK